MAERAALVVERNASQASRSAIRKAASYLRDLGYDVASAGPSGGVHHDIRADVVLFSTGSDRRSAIAEVKRLHHAFPRAYVIVTADRFDTDVVAKAYSAGAAAVAPPSGFVDAVRNVVYVSHHGSEVQLPRIVDTTHFVEESPVVNAFHDAETGRLDARRVADALGLSLSALAGALGVTQSALSKRPNARAAQAALRELEFAWATLLKILGSAEKARAWLHSGRRDLAGKAPIQLLVDGSAEGFANYIRSVLAGEPG